MVSLENVKRGQSFKVENITSDSIRAQAIRFGISEGEFLVCEEVIPGGPIVVKKNRQLIALGRDLAREIKVSL
ncbi:MAG: FeoA family protein [Desulfitobacterium hafniense]|nr:FeoA family protein [Desulfitobacterium hafniense]